MFNQFSVMYLCIKRKKKSIFYLFAENERVSFLKKLSDISLPYLRCITLSFEKFNIKDSQQELIKK